MIFNNSIYDRERAHRVAIAFGAIGTVKQILAPIENASSYTQRKVAAATLQNITPNLSFSPF